jgi:hypothetical protein
MCLGVEDALDVGVDVGTKQKNVEKHRNINIVRLMPACGWPAACLSTSSLSNIICKGDRMPVVLAEPDVDAWPAGAAGSELLRPVPSEALRLWPVSRRVNRTGEADDPSLIEPLTEPPEQATRRAAP